MSHKLFTPDQEQLIITEYLAGRTLKELVATYGGSDVSITNVLKRNNIPRRPSYRRSNWVGDEQTKADVISRYQNGESIESLAKSYVTSETNIRDTLKEANVDITFKGGRHNRKFDDQKLKVLVEKYQAGSSLRTLAKEYNVSVGTVRNSLLRAGIQTRESARPDFWTEERLEELKILYGYGMSQRDIALYWHISQTAVSRKLISLGVISVNGPQRGEYNHQWKGGRIRRTGGYIGILVTEDDAHLAPMGYYYPEHRLVMARHLNRPLRNTETVHHIDGNRQNNDINNLQLRQGQHGNHIVMVCGDCGSFNLNATPIADDE